MVMVAVVGLSMSKADKFYQNLYIIRVVSNKDRKLYSPLNNPGVVSTFIQISILKSQSQSKVDNSSSRHHGSWDRQ